MSDKKRNPKTKNRATSELVAPKTTVLHLPALHQAQRGVVEEAKRWNIVCCGRRWGKSVLGIDRLIQPALYGQPVAFFSPTYKMLTEIWRDVRMRLAPIVASVSTQQRRLELLTGGVVEMWSLDNPDTIRGRKYALAVIDEAAMVKDLATTWQQVIRPTLTDMCGSAWMLSTPRGRGFFWECFMRGQHQEHDWCSWQMPTSANPHIAPEEVEAMRLELPQRAYQQEILAQFLDDTGSVFRRILEAAIAEEQDGAIAGHSYIIGVDWARSGDYSCFVVLDSTTSHMVYLDRFTDTTFDVQMMRLRGLYERFQPNAIIAEENSMGLPLVEQLGNQGYPIVAFRTTNASKQAIIDALALAFEQAHIRILNNPVLISELLAFEIERLPSGLLRYSAPSGQHDDTVMALALAWYGASTAGPVILW